MKKIVGLWVHFVCASISVFSQVDTTLIYNTAMPYGTLDLRIAKSPTRYYYLQENVTYSFRESAPGVKTNTYRDMTSWNSAPYKEGNLREKSGNNDFFVMNYRLLPPVNYNASFPQGYPIIIMIHGAGERANCWEKNCYWSTVDWNPNTNSPPAPVTATSQLLNNDNNLVHGGSQHLAAVNLAGSKLPDDPTLAPRAFPGFVLFPQSLNGWSQASRIEDAIRILRLLIKKYNIDENRIYIHGLSNGGGGVYQALKRAPWLFAAALPMSAINNGGIISDGLVSEVAKIPIWTFQGGQDKNPTPSRTFGTVRSFRDAGAEIKYTLYPTIGHGTWNNAYNEPDFFKWMLSKRKSNPHIYYVNPVICGTTGAGVPLSFSKGFPAYQWQMDGQVISNANGAEYVANTPGTYRGRFSRKFNPSETDWEPWSDPVVVTEINPAKPIIQALSSTHLRGPGLPNLDVNNTVILKAAQNADLYNWFKNGVPINFSATDIDDTLRTVTFTSAGTFGNGAYTLVSKYTYCPSPPSDPVNLFYNNSAPQNFTLDPTATEFKGTVITNGVFLTWNDLVNNELGYEIWRRKSGTTYFKFAGRTSKDAISFYDSPLEPGTTYEYKLRAVNNTGASNYIPSNDLNVNYSITTAGDDIAPTAPQQLIMTGNTIGSMTLKWQPATDNTGIKKYLINYGGTEISTDTSLTTFTVKGLPPNTVYPVFVRAVDYSGKISPASNQIMASTYVLGLFYKHSTGYFLNLQDTAILPTWINPEFTGTVPNFTLAPRTQEDYFNFMFTGYLDIVTAGNYIFRVTSDDASRLKIDDSVFVDNDGQHGSITVISDTFSLEKGPHPLEVQYFEYIGGQSLIVQYKGPDLTAPFINIPDSVLRSGKYIPPSPPAVPPGITATGNGMQRIDITWQSTDEVEIYRSSKQTGPFVIIGRNSTGAFPDTVGLIPATTYYYKLKTVSATGVSALSATVAAATLADAVAPTIPTSLLLINKTQTRAAFTWTASTDNVSVTGYEIYSNGTLVGTTVIPAYMATDLLPSSTYSIKVLAFDANGNRSGLSDELLVSTVPSAIYYSMPNGDLSLVSTWKQNANGTGNSPLSFTENAQYFIISNRAQASISSPWEVSGSASKVVVPTGVTLSIDQPFAAALELEGTAVVNFNNSTMPELQKISAASTVNFNMIANIPKKIYGNVILSGTGAKSFEPDTTVILGNLTVNNGIILKGGSGNTTSLFLSGNLAVNGIAGATAADNTVHLILIENTSHTITANGDLYFYHLAIGQNATVTFTNNNASLRLGSLNGGGVKIATGSLLNIGNNSLHLTNAATINPGNESGRIGVNGGDIKIASSSAQHTNLYFDPANNNADTLEVNLTGSGTVIIREPVKITDAVRIKNGELNSGGNISLLSSAIKTASIAQIQNNGMLSGNINVQQYMDALGDSWRELSAPVSGVTIAKWQNYFPVTGQFTGSSGGTSSPSMFVSNGTGMLAYPPTGGSNQAAIEKGKGYSARINQAAPFTIEVSGNPFQGSVSIPLSAGAAGGWNLVGNPYASSIAWNSDPDAWIKTGISNVIAVKENKLINGQPVGQFVYYHPLLGEGIIKAGHGFWIQSLNQSSSLIVKEKAKRLGTISSAETGNTVSHLTINLQQGSLSDAAYILFTADAIDAFDNLNDAKKKLNEGMFNLSSISSDNINLAVNSLPNSFCSKTVKLNLQNVQPGSYSLVFSSLETLAEIGKATLTDNFTGSVSPAGPTAYSFSVTADPASYGANRFILTFSRQQLDTATPKINALNVCDGESATATISNSQPGVDYVILNENGQEISDRVEGGSATIQLALTTSMLKPGVNHVKVRAGFKGCDAQLLASGTDITYSPAFEITLQPDVSVCLGDKATLQASGVPAGGHYNWYDENDTEIVSVKESSLTTLPVWHETSFSVQGVQANGCASKSKTIHLYVDTLDVPTITLFHDTLFVQVEAQYQWLKDGQSIPGATKPYIVPNGTGNYTVVVSHSGCTRESSPFAYVADPGCQLDTKSPVVKTEDSCGDDIIRVSILNSQPQVIYAIINKDKERISTPVTGNGGTVELELSSMVLDSGANHFRVRADLPGCVDRVLQSEISFNYTPISVPVITVQNDVLVTNAKGLLQWRKNFENIPGATNSSFTPVVSGSYSVVATKGSCSKESAPLEFLVTGIEDPYHGEFVLNTYPVPATSENLLLRVQSPKTDEVFIKIIDITGRPIFQKYYSISELGPGIPVTPSSGPMQNGIYIVIARQGSIEIRKRVIIKN